MNQIGLTDTRPGRPWRDIEQMYESTLGTSYQSILRNHMTYYPTWKNEYLEWVRLQYGQTLIAEWPLLAKIRAWQMHILYFDPVVYDWQHIDTKALVMGGSEDRLTRNYPDLARQVSETLQNASLKLYPGVGHNPHFEIPDEYHANLIEFLSSDPNN
ncbi:MAG: alpha/beta hydrolase [Pseudohongiellaceae bacterium]|nr:alpha/beta hydrolase [Pseudohongiellaceae bacterium]